MDIINQISVVELTPPLVVVSLTCKYLPSYVFISHLIFRGGDDPHDMYPYFPDSRGPGAGGITDPNDPLRIGGVHRGRGRGGMNPLGGPLGGGGIGRGNPF